MTQDEIIKMARNTANHATLASGEISYTFYLKQLEAFAKLVAAKERTWVGLTDKEIDKKLRVYEQDYGWISFAKAIEAKLKQKNGFAEEKNNG